MRDALKYIWTNISFRKWTFEGKPLRNPLAIIRMILLSPIVLLAKYIYLLAYFTKYMDIEDTKRQRNWMD